MINLTGCARDCNHNHRARASLLITGPMFWFESKWFFKTDQLCFARRYISHVGLPQKLNNELEQLKATIITPLGETAHYALCVEDSAGPRGEPFLYYPNAVQRHFKWRGCASAWYIYLGKYFNARTNHPNFKYILSQINTQNPNLQKNFKRKFFWVLINFLLLEFVVEEVSFVNEQVHTKKLPQTMIFIVTIVLGYNNLSNRVITTLWKKR